jgi:hypothetical protein
MSWLLDLRLIGLFDFYLAAVFLIGIVVRFRQYAAIVALVRTVPDRWPRLLQLVRQHSHIFLTWGTVLPLVVSFTLMAVQMLASRWLWPEAELTFGRLLHLWPAFLVVMLCATAMVAFDAYWSFSVSELNRAELEGHLDQAEYWLRSWTAPVVRFFTLGFINPRQMVAAEVRAALLSASAMLNSTLWWLAIQAGLRIACGLSLWGTWALAPWLDSWLHPSASHAGLTAPPP